MVKDNNCKGIVMTVVDETVSTDVITTVWPARKETEAFYDVFKSSLVVYYVAV